MRETEATIERYLEELDLSIDGDPIDTFTSLVVPVRSGGRPAMLKISRIEDERRGNGLMAWWSGLGAARVLRSHGDAILMERASAAGTLADMVRSGRDDEATRIACRVVSALHKGAPGPRPVTKALSDMFHGLHAIASSEGGILARSSCLARELLAEGRDEVVLHGDVHHGNILDFGPRGWLAIDPKGFLGDRAFDYANLFCNPDAGIALAPGRLARTAAVVAGEAGLARGRLLGWVQVAAALFTAWLVETGQPVAHDIEVARLAEAGRLAP